MPQIKDVFLFLCSHNARKKYHSFQDLKKIFNIPESHEKIQEKSIRTPIDPQNLTVHLSKKYRRGKTVTLIVGFTCENFDVLEIAKELKKELGVGGTVKGKQIVIQGNCRNQVAKILSKQGHNIKLVGS